LLALGRVDDAAALFEKNTQVLEALARDSDTLKVQYLLGCMLHGLGEAHSHRAANLATRRTERLAQWRLASASYEKAIPHFERVTAGVKLDHMDRRPVDEAIAGLVRAKAEIVMLTAR
jgi:hypothetical protein